MLFEHISNLEKNMKGTYKFIKPFISFSSIGNKNKIIYLVNKINLIIELLLLSS